MKRHAHGSFACAVFAALLLFSGEGLAHGVNVFAFVDGDAVQVECGFSKTRKVVNGKIVVTDLATGVAVLEGTTNELGVLRFRPSDEFLATGHGLNIHLFAGEGHEDEWKINPDELRALSSAATNGSPPARINSTVDMAALEEMIAKVFDAKLAPVRHALAEQQDDGPELRDIVGGIGWILGLLGLAAYMKYRRQS